MSLREDANEIIRRAIDSALPHNAVRAALCDYKPDGNIYVVAVGKAAWAMAETAADVLGERIKTGIVITKHGYSKGNIAGFDIYEAGHPVPDADTYTATQAVIDMVSPLGSGDNVVFLLSGGGSALFEKPLIPAEDTERLTRELLASGADIVEINTLRKRFSAVKGGRFAKLCSPARIYSIILSDVIGDRLDMIASGPAVPDSSTADEAKSIAARYKLTLTDYMKSLLDTETPKELDNVETHVTGNVAQLCLSAEKTCAKLGYKPITLTASLSCTARDAGVFLANIAQKYANSGERLAFIAGGETVVHLTGSGMGGRNQEIALAAAEGIAGLENVCVFSVGSDGTDGPTDAAGGYADGYTKEILKNQGVGIYETLQNNDAYHALEKCGGLIKTGATGTNVNDLSVLLIG